MSAEIKPETEGRNPPIESYSDLQLFFLLRLNRMVYLRRESGLDEDKIRLLDWSIYSTFLDCLEQRVGEDARTILPGKEAASRKPSQEPK